MSITMVKGYSPPPQDAGADYNGFSYAGYGRGLNEAGRPGGYSRVRLAKVAPLDGFGQAGCLGCGIPGANPAAMAAHLQKYGQLGYLGEPSFPTNPLVLAGAAFAAWFLLLRKKR